MKGKDQGPPGNVAVLDRELHSGGTTREQGPLDDQGPPGDVAVCDQEPPGGPAAHERGPPGSATEGEGQGHHGFRSGIKGLEKKEKGRKLNVGRFGDFRFAKIGELKQ